MSSNIDAMDQHFGHGDDPELFKALIQKSDVAWPTIMLLAIAYAIFGKSIFTYVDGALPLFWTILFNAIAS